MRTQHRQHNGSPFFHAPTPASLAHDVLHLKISSVWLLMEEILGALPHHILGTHSHNPATPIDGTPCQAGNLVMKFSELPL
jgi:hypothetical protein